ncbi:hypothetical protein OH76DRAFT_1487680 [Lentinus brumalis]|uniref:Uncharacterized protein n=1 Tax=Lentinus brumalis TaxID=2498619 RepID=A0A371CTN2_9APHY|nr:hypothetical protein OH76DRAFT_1487680 [Polyporus brumalis]
MSATTVDWLDSASLLKQRLDRLDVPPRRRTMLDGLLKLATTYARLACYLGTRPHDDNPGDYEIVEDGFIEAMQGFQEKTLQRVLGWKDTVDGVFAEHADTLDMEQEDGLSAYARAYYADSGSSRSSCSRSSGAEEYDIEAADVLRSTGSSPVSDKQWDPAEELYSRVSTSLVADLQEPLHASLADPLLQELEGKMAASAELVSSLAATLREDAHFLDAIATHVHKRITGLPTTQPLSPGLPRGTPSPSHGAGGAHAPHPDIFTLPSPTTSRRPAHPGRAHVPSGSVISASGRALKRELSPLLLDAKRARATPLAEKRGR